eukprot:1149983-Pelagomonas_calceolata.AAC.3
MQARRGANDKVPAITVALGSNLRLTSQSDPDKRPSIKTVGLLKVESERALLHHEMVAIKQL